MKTIKISLIIIGLIILGYIGYYYFGYNIHIYPLYKVRYIDKTGKVIYKAKNYISDLVGIPSFSEGMLAIKEKNKWGYIDKTGKNVVAVQYDMACDFCEGLAAVKKGGKWCYINKSGERITKFQYDEASDFSEGLAAVRRGNNSYYINKSGREVINCGEYQYRSNSFSEGLAVLEDDTVINKKGERLFIAPTCGAFYKYSQGVLIVRDPNTFKMSLLDKKGKLIMPYKYDVINIFKEDATSAKIGDNWYIINNKGKELCNFGKKYIEIGKCSEGLFKVVKKDRLLKGFIDKSGKEVIPCVYTFARDFSEGIAPVSKVGRYGYINKQGKTVIPFKYEQTYVAIDGVMLVFDKKDLIYMDKNENEILRLNKKFNYPLIISDGVIVVCSIRNFDIFVPKSIVINY